jgi:hypothetical protein
VERAFASRIVKYEIPERNRGEGPTTETENVFSPSVMARSTQVIFEDVYINIIGRNSDETYLMFYL